MQTSPQQPANGRQWQSVPDCSKPAQAASNASRCPHTKARRPPKAWGMGKSRCKACASRIRAQRNRKYLATAKGQATRKRWLNSEKGKASHAAAVTRYRRRKIRENDPHFRYSKQKAHAAARGIPFLLTFDEWWAIWEPYWELRGRSRDAFVMGRIGDVGPYAVGNVKIITHEQNRVEAVENRRARQGSSQRPTERPELRRQPVTGPLDSSSRRLAAMAIPPDRSKPAVLQWQSVPDCSQRLVKTASTRD